MKQLRKIQKKLELNLNPELNQSFHTKRMVQKLADSLTIDRYALLSKFSYFYDTSLLPV